MILGALSDAGGREYLHRQADLNPAAFMTLVGKVLPLTLQGAGPGGAILISGVRRNDDGDAPQYEFVPIAGNVRTINGDATDIIDGDATDTTQED
jgi:hypothetical protein